MGWQRLWKREKQLLWGGGESQFPVPVLCVVPTPTDTLPSFVVPATCPVAMVTISGWTARLRVKEQRKRIQLGEGR